jgi:hypothetical protein
MAKSTQLTTMQLGQRRANKDAASADPGNYFSTQLRIELLKRYQTFDRLLSRRLIQTASSVGKITCARPTLFGQARVIVSSAAARPHGKPCAAAPPRGASRDSRPSRTTDRRGAFLYASANQINIGRGAAATPDIMHAAARAAFWRGPASQIFVGTFYVPRRRGDR